MAKELKPCPFCNFDKSSTRNIPERIGELRGQRVCRGCWGAGPLITTKFELKDASKNIIEEHHKQIDDAWNNRSEVEGWKKQKN